MSKYIKIIFLSIISLFIISCGNNNNLNTNESNEANGKKKIALVYSTAGKGDKSFNDSAYEGIKRAAEDFNIEYSEYEPNDPSAEARDAISSFAETYEYDLIITIGFALKDSLESVAIEYPEQKFAMIDEVVELPNVASIVFKEEEGSFLVGALAAMMSETGTIGYLGGAESPTIQRFQAGYEQGARYINPDINIVSVYIGGTNAFNDPTDGKAKSETMIRQGADVLYHAAAGSGFGMFQAVKENNIYGIGVDSNQDDVIKGRVLTSMMKYVNNAVYRLVEDVVNNNFIPGVSILGVAENGVGTTEFEFTRELIGEEKINKLEEIKQDIINGNIQIHDKVE